MTTAEILSRAKDGANVPVPPLAQAVGMSRGGLYRAIANGEVASVRIGRAVFVPAHEVRRLLGIKPEPEPQLIAA